jgi:hypothetical protein
MLNIEKIKTRIGTWININAWVYKNKELPTSLSKSNRFMRTMALTAVGIDPCTRSTLRTRKSLLFNSPKTRERKIVITGTMMNLYPNMVDISLK